MSKSGIEIDIPGFGDLCITAIRSDYTGTLSCDRKLFGGVRERLRKLVSRGDDIYRDFG
jgi:hypothetical protein